MYQNQFLTNLYENFYSSSQYNKGQSLKENEELFQTHLNCINSLLNLDTNFLTHQTIQSSICMIKNIPSLSGCVSNKKKQDIKEIILNILKETSLLYNYLVNSLSLLSSLCQCIETGENAKAKKIISIYDRIKHMRELFEESTKMKFIDPCEITKVDLKDSLPALISAYNEQMGVLNDECNKLMDSLREKHHMCLACRNKPALYYATPCLHPCFCESCINEFVRQKFTYGRCLNCKEIVKGVETLSFFANNRAIV